MPDKRIPVIDFHAHMLEDELLRRAAGKTVLSGFGASPHGATRAVNETTIQKMLDPERQLADMDHRGIDMHVVSSGTVIQGTSWADPRTDLELTQRCNDRVAPWVAKYPRRFVGSFTLPLQDVDLALGELRRAALQLGLRVANLCTQYQGAYIGEARYRPFWEAANELDLVVWIHPEGIRMDPEVRHVELDRPVDRGSEGDGIHDLRRRRGGFSSSQDRRVARRRLFPHNMGRMDRNVTNRPDSMKNITRKPSEYLRSFYYDTCLFDPGILAALIRRVGADRVVMGSDYPVGEWDPIGFIQQCPGISETDAAMIAGGTAARLLRLPAAA